MTRNVVLLLLLGVLLSACQGLGGEPDIIATLPPPTNAPIVNDLGYPEAPPDLALGAALYAENCTDCHGQNGAGDGELVQSGQVMNPGNFTDPAQIAGKNPADYFDIITNGNLENLMPPWRDALTESERWAVALYTYTLHYDADQLAAGAEIYARECAECHGETGLGDGPEAESARGAGNLADPESMAFLSDDNINVLVAEGAGADMPAYQDVLTADEIQAVTAYTRTLALQNIDAIMADVPVAQTQAEVTSEPQPTAAGEPVVVTVSGEVTNGTAGASVPPDLTVTLRSFDAEMNETTVDTTVQDGRYAFEDVTLQPGLLYFVSAEYAGQSYGTPSFNSATPELAENLPLLIYEPTDDPGVITIDQMITEILPAGEVLEIRQDVTFTNTSDRLFVGAPVEGETDETRTFTLPLPVGAVMALLPQSGRYVYDDERFILSDTRAVLPGQNQIRFVYLLQYGDGAVIEYPVEHAVSGPVLILLAGDALRFESEQFQAIDPSVAPDADVQPFGANINLPPGALIRYELLGRAPGIGTSQDPDVITSDNLLLILIGAFGVLALAVGGVIYFNVRGRTGRAAAGDQRMNQLVSQIADLDAQHDAGQINHDLYHQRRAELKAEMSELMNEQDNA